MKTNVNQPPLFLNLQSAMIKLCCCQEVRHICSCCVHSYTMNDHLLLDRTINHHVTVPSTSVDVQWMLHATVHLLSPNRSLQFVYQTTCNTITTSQSLSVHD